MPDPNHKNGARGDGRKCESLRVRCTDEEECGWQGARRKKAKGGAITAKPCPKCGKPVYRPEKKRMYQIAAQKRLKAMIPEEDRVLLSATRAVTTELDAATISKVAELIEVGNFPSTAAQAAGVPNNTFNQWMMQGRKDWANEEDTIFSRLYLQIEQSKAIAEVNIVNMGLDKIENNQSTWMGAFRHLESFGRERWLKTQEINLNATHTVKDSIDVPPAPPQSHEEWLSRRMERESVQDAEFEELEDA